MEKIKIKTEFIKLNQALKLSGRIMQGSDIKIFLEDGVIRVNGSVVFERGKKLYIGDKVEIEGMEGFEITG